MRLLVAGALLWAAMVFTGCGGSSDHENARVMGVVSDCDGNPVSDVILTLYPDDYNPLRDEGVISQKSVSNCLGTFDFESIPHGLYTITAVDQFNSRGLIRKGVEITGESISLDTITVNSYGVLRFHPDSLDLKKGTAVFIPGTEFVQMIDTTEISLYVPPGIVILSAYDSEKGLEFTLLKNYQKVEIVPERYLHIGFFYPSPLYMDSTGEVHNELTGKVGQVYKFTAEFPVRTDIYSSYRFSWGDDLNAVGDWVDNCLQAHSWSEPGVYDIQYQVMYKGSLHSWSSVLTIRIER